MGEECGCAGQRQEEANRVVSASDGTEGTACPRSPAPASAAPYMHALAARVRELVEVKRSSAVLGTGEVRGVYEH